ncbi:MAG: ChaB family protein [Armatimonas sp.]
MPYTKRSELPENVSNVLPKHAQEIFLAAFNNAWNEYASPEKREGGRDREETAFAVAWSAVKHSYEKDEAGHWVEKEE